MIETNRIEFKRELSSKLEKEVVGFLNNPEGGTIYIGIDDSGKFSNIKDLDNTQLKIIDRIKDGILPSTLGLFDVRVEGINDEKVIAITISSGTEKPYYIKKLGMSPNGTYIRVGNSTHPMTVDMIEDLYSSGIFAPRNKEIMRIFKDVKLVEHLGSGVKRILEKYDESVFDITPNFMRVTFPFDKWENVGENVGENMVKNNIKISKVQRKILSKITNNKEITQKELAILLKVTERTIERNTIILQEKGLVKRIGPANGGYWEVIK